MSGFRKATKEQARARIAFAGPGGSGKTFTALVWAQVLGQRIGVIDTERRSASLYADLFDFDAFDMAPPYHPQRLIDALDMSAAAGHDVTVIDSVSHFWAGEGGVLEIVDQAKAGHDSFRAWSKGTPLQQRMVDSLLRHPGHVIVTMRSKTEYALVREGDKSRVEKLGLAPVQRDGIEYEFTVIQDIDMRHIAHVTKTRCPDLTDRDIPPELTELAAREFAAWLGTGAPLPPPADPEQVRALQARLTGLDPVIAQTVRDRWTKSGLPVLRHLTTATELESAVAMVDQLVPAQRPPHDDETPGAES